MIVFPNCKINIGLHVLSKRADGFHNIETLFYPIPLQDALEVINTKLGEPLQFSFSGLQLDVNLNENICAKAFQLLKKDFDLPPAQMHLHKVIPSGAGLGGGSADGAFTLMLLNKKFNLNLSEQQLMKYALELGSDCPFFIKNKPCIATSRGEILQEIDIDLSSYNIIMVSPQIHINTGWAFQQLSLSTRNVPLTELVHNPIKEWKGLIINDFEKPVFASYPEIQTIKENLYSKGALFASMSGSGSSVYGIFEKGAKPVFSFPSGYLVKEC